MIIQSDQITVASSETILNARDDGPLTVAENGLLFGADFVRAGPDLILRNEGAADIRVIDYFRTETPVDLHAPDGGSLPGAWIAKLAGPLAPGQYAQAGGTDPGDVIGQVETFNGSASVQRVDGTQEDLTEGSSIFLGDIVSTGRGGTVSITFVDGTIFSLSAGSRMVIDELVYTPAGSQNSAAFNLIQGGFVFVAGQIAPTGGMEVNTPAATMGIRGTTVISELRVENGLAVSEITLTEDPVTGEIGRIELFDRQGNLLAEVTQTDTKYIVTAGGEISEVERNAEDEEADNILLEQLLAAFEEASIRVEQGGNFVELNGANQGGAQDDGTGLAPDAAEDTQDNLDLDSEDAAPPPEAEEPEDTPPEPDSFDEGRNQTNEFIQQASVDLEVTSTTSDAQGSVVEDQTTSTGGQLSATGEDVTWTGSAPGAVGQFIISEDGTWVYDTNEAANGLGDGDQLTEVFTATVTDGEGGSATQDVTVTVTGTNDAPVVTSNAAAAEGNATENSVPVVSGVLVASDADSGASLNWTGSTQGQFGDFQISPDGNWVYATSTNAENLSEGQVVTETFTATVADDQGATVDQDVIITLTGQNDAPTITSQVGARIRLVEDVSPTATGQITATDIDANTTLTFSAPAQGTFGSFAIDADGNWTYTAGPEADKIAGGEIVFETITVTVSDDQGATATQDIDISITGTNDVPIVTTAAGAKSGSIDLSVATTASGQLTATDPDQSATVGSEQDFARAAIAATATAPLVWSGSAEGQFGSFTIDANGAWNYVANEGAEALAAGQVVTESFVATVTDDQGGTAVETVTITLTGTNETPLITGDTTGNITENTVPTASGQLTATDADAAALLWSGSTQGVYGTFNITETGAWTYVSGAAAEALAEGQVVTETFTATVTDDLGASSSEVITITLTGTNDAPVITGDVTGTVVEDVTPTASGQLTATDFDTGAVLTWSGSASGLYGTFNVTETGAWTYVSGPGAEALSEGQIVTETFTATVTDEQGAASTAIVTISLTGSNDAPVITGDTTGNVIENTVPIASGQLAADDSDTEALSWSGSTEGVYGTFNVTETGAWTYSSGPAAETLAEGQVVTEDFVVSATDDLGGTVSETVTISVTGTNDLPFITSERLAYAEGQTTGQLTATDIDTTDSVTFALNDESANGTVEVSPDGAFIFDPAPGFPGIVGFDYTATDSAGGIANGRMTLLGQSEPLTLGNGDVVDIDLERGAGSSAPLGHALITQAGSEGSALDLTLVFDTSLALSPEQWALQLDNVVEALRVVQPDLQSSNVAVQVVTFADTAQFEGSFGLNDNLFETIVSLEQSDSEVANVSDAFSLVDDLRAEFGEADSSSTFLFSPAPLAPEFAGPESDIVQVNGSPLGSVSPFLFTDIAVGGLEQTLDDLVPTSVSVKMISDGTDLGEIATAADITPQLNEDGISYALAEIPGIADLLGEENLIAFGTTISPFLGDFGSFEIGASEVFAKAETPRTIVGSDKADLVLGSDGADDIRVGEGADVVLGFAGDDLIDAGIGADTIKAGAGDDTIRIDLGEGGQNIQVEGGLGEDVLALSGVPIGNFLANIDLSGIETLDLDNQQSDIVNLTVEDVLDLYTPAEAELDVLLEEALPAFVVIEGGVRDVISLETSEGISAQATGETSVSETGAVLNHFTFSEGSDVLATLAIDADIAVSTQSAAAV